MKKLKNRKFLFVGVAILLVMSGILLSSSRDKREIWHDSSVTQINSGPFENYIGNIREGIFRIQKKLKLASPLPVEQLDFSIDGDKQIGADMRYNIFSSEGGQVFPINHLKDQSYWGEFVKGDHLIFTLGNKVIGIGTEQSDLLVAFPEVTDIMCQMLNKRVGVGNEPSEKIPEIPRLNLTPHPKIDQAKNIVDLQNPKACVRLPDGKNYYYEVLVER